MPEQSYFLNGKAHGQTAQILSEIDPGKLRPFVENGKAWCEVVNGYDSDGTPKTKVIPYHPVINAVATLPRDAWKWIDDAVVRVEQEQANFLPMMEAAGLSLTIPDGMSVTGIESSVMTDITDARTAMDPEAESDHDQPELDTRFMPLPVTFKDIGMSLRQRNTSRRAGFAFDTTLIEASTEKVLQKEEELAVGTTTGITFGGGTVYGLTNHPDRITKVLTSPTAPGWTGDTLVEELMEMRESLKDAQFRGPFWVGFGPSWDLHLDKDYSAAKGDLTVRQRVMQTPNMNGGDTINYLSGYEVIVMSRNSRTFRIINGMPLSVVQWEAKGGFRLRFKVLSIRVPEVRANAEGIVGIVHGEPV